MGDKIIGISSVTEVSMTRKAMNKHCTKIMLKSKDAGGVTAETTTTEESEMDPKIMKSFAGLQARVGATAMGYVAQLEDDKVKSFFEQDEAAQDAEVKAYDEAEKAKSAEAEAKAKEKAAGDPIITALQAQVEDLKTTVKSLTGDKGETALKEKAKSYPNVPGALDALRAVSGLTDEQQAPTLALLKSQNDMAGVLTARTIVDPSTIEGSPASVLKSKVKAHAEAKSISQDEAYLAVTADPANADLIQQVRDEEDGIAA